MSEPKTRTIEADDYGNPKVDEIEVRSIKFPVYFREGGLAAYVTAEDDSGRLAVTAKTIEELKGLLTRHTAGMSGKINVPFLAFVDDVDRSYGSKAKNLICGANPHFDRLHVRGIHASTHNILVRREGEKRTEQWNRWSHSGKEQHFRGDMPEEIQRQYIATFRDEQEAINRRVKIAKEWSIDIDKTAKEAVEQVLA